MQHSWARKIKQLLLLTALYSLSGAALETPSDTQLAGLAVHQETGRSIYLGGIYFDQALTRPFDYTSSLGPRIMEYRVIARRTSMRSLLGGMLLQSEVATSKAPDTATRTFAQAILSAVQGSLYSGDILEIKLDANGDTTAHLNNHLLASSPGPSVSNYLMMGWVGERGPATVFRDSILGDRINPQLLAMQQRTTYSGERSAQVVAWTTADQAAEKATENGSDTAAPAPTATPEKTPGPAPDAAIATAVALEEVQPVAKARFTLPPPAAEPPADVADPGRPVTPTNTIQVASLQPAQELLQDARLDVASMDIKLYSQRLSAFHTGVVSKVYGEIRYPRRAVKRGLEGRLELDLTLEEDGSLLEVSVVQSSGHNMLDEAAVKAAESAFKGNALERIDPVAVAEFSTSGSGRLVIPVPVMFMLTQ